MLSATAWMWLLGALAIVAAAGFALGLLRDGARRRARHAYYAQAARASRPQSLTHSAPAPLSGGMTPEQAASIRAHAERTAQRDWAAARSSAINPYDHGTPEYVLWYATYQLRMGDLAEQAEADAEREGRQDSP